MCLPRLMVHKLKVFLCKASYVYITWRGRGSSFHRDLTQSEREKKRGGGGLCRIFFPLVQIVTNSCGIKRKGQTLTNSVIICKKSNNLTHVPSIFYLEQECLCTVQCMKCKPEKIHVTEKYGAYITLLILASVQCQIFSSWSMAPFSEKIL